MPKKQTGDEDLQAFDLKAARKAKKLTQVEVAEILCTTQGSVARWEAAGTLPRLHRKYWEIYWHTQKLARRKAKATA